MDSLLVRVISLLYFVKMSVKAENRFCSFETNGDLKYYICPRNEFCCKLGCCLNPNFQFYQLWYYWLMVIFMLVVCSGGQWWYRYWVHGAVGEELSRRPPPTRRPTQVTYHHARDSVTVLHHFAKPAPYGNSRSSPPPSYSQTAMEEGSSATPRPKASPYSQLYGPPPSYDQAMAGVHTSGQHSADAEESSAQLIAAQAQTSPLTPASPSTTAQSPQDAAAATACQESLPTARAEETQSCQSREPHC